jgi:glycosyltransferase involved in cell wall biosynthesis
MATASGEVTASAEHRAARVRRVLLVDLARGFGGCETRVISQAHALQGVVERCAVAVLRGRPLHQRLLREGIPCEPVSDTRLNPRVLSELRAVIRRGGYQVVDAHNIQSIFWGHLAALLAGAPGRITTMHSDYRQEYTGVRKRLYPLVYGLVRPITSHFVHVNHQLQEQAIQRGDGRRSTLIPNTVAIADPESQREPRRTSEWGFEQTDFVVAVVGRLFPVKGQAYAIDAMASLRDLPQVKLLLVGDGPQRAELAARAAALGLTGRVHFAGFRDDVTRLLQMVDCVCLPSLWENLPYAALEAAAQRLPIVATAVGGVPQFLDDGETALLVPPRDAGALAAAVRRLVEEPAIAARLGAAAHAMVRRSFGPDELLRKTLDVYDSVLT